MGFVGFVGFVVAKSIVAIIVYAPLALIWALVGLFKFFSPLMTVKTVTHDIEGYKVSLDRLLSKVFGPSTVSGLGLISSLLAGAVVATWWVMKAMFLLGFALAILALEVAPFWLVRVALTEDDTIGLALAAAFVFVIDLFVCICYWDRLDTHKTEHWR